MSRLLALLACLLLSLAQACSSSPPQFSAGSAPAPDSAKFTIRGRVVDQRGGPLPEGVVGVWLVADGPGLWARPEEDGSFQFRLRERPTGASIKVDPGKRWRVIRPSAGDDLPLTEAQINGDEEVLVEVAERLGGRAHGIAVDQRTGLPIPGLRFRIQAKDPNFFPRYFKPLEITTDAEGRFSTEREIYGGPVLVQQRMADCKPVVEFHDLQMDRATAERPWKLLFRKGPIIPLELVGDLPQDSSSLFARAFFQGDVEVLSSTPVRTSSRGAWVRATTAELPAHSEVTLVVSDGQGFRVGFQTFAWAGGEDQSPVRIELRRTGRVAVSWFHEGSTDPGWGIQEVANSYPICTIQPLSASQVKPWTGEEQFSLSYLPPGRYRIQPYSRTHVGEAQEVEVSAEAIAEVHFQMQRVPGGREVRGRFRTESGAPPPDCSLMIRSLVDPVLSWTVKYHATLQICGDMAWCFAEHVEDSDPPFARFVIRGFPPGEFELEATCFRKQCSTQFIEREDGTVEIEVLVLDGEASGD